MPNKKQLRQQLLVTGCAAIVACSTGCRSAMPKWNMFSFGKTPSAEMLAGNGPTHTYPPPPSASATPMAIASNAAGTTEMVADAGGISPATRVAANNMAAAQANGFALASGTSAANASDAPQYALSSNVTADKNASVPAIPTGYQFGSKAAASPASMTASTNSGYQVPSSYPAPSTAPATGAPSGMGGSAYQLPSSATSPIASTGATMPSASGNTGFALPDDVMNSVKQASAGATQSQPFMPKSITPTSATSEPAGTAVSALSMPSTGATASSSMTMPGGTPAATVGTGNSKPSFSTASASLPTGDSSLSLPSNGVQGNTGSFGGYAPGSTGASSGYPATSGYPSPGTNGSFYR